MTTKPLIGTANLLAGQAVSLAEGFLADRNTAAQIESKILCLFAELRRLKLSQEGLQTSSIIDAAYVLNTALSNACQNPQNDHLAVARANRWRELLGCLVEHVRRESLVLKDEGHLS